MEGADAVATALVGVFVVGLVAIAVLVARAVHGDTDVRDVGTTTRDEGSNNGDAS